MKRGFKILVFAVVSFFAFYSVYYYSNFRGKEPPKVFKDGLANTTISAGLNTDASGSNKIYSPLSRYLSSYFLDSTCPKNDWQPLNYSLKINEDYKNTKDVVLYADTFHEKSNLIIADLLKEKLELSRPVDFNLEPGSLFLYGHSEESIVFKNDFRIWKNSENPDYVMRALAYNPSTEGKSKIKFLKKDELQILEISLNKKTLFIVRSPDQIDSLIDYYSLYQNYRDQLMNIASEESVQIPMINFFIEHSPNSKPDLGYVSNQDTQLLGKMVMNYSLEIKSEYSLFDRSFNPDSLSPVNSLRFPLGIGIIDHSHDKAQLQMLVHIIDHELLVEEKRL